MPMPLMKLTTLKQLLLLKKTLPACLFVHTVRHCLLHRRWCTVVAAAADVYRYWQCSITADDRETVVVVVVVVVVLEKVNEGITSSSGTDTSTTNTSTCTTTLCATVSLQINSTGTSTTTTSSNPRCRAALRDSRFVVCSCCCCCDYLRWCHTQHNFF